ncbi:GW dipeptide domain-containing protein [Planococcus sp. N028]|uniref:GW dipeptide domain-containing protein n=1 Tax=Planococcus shixiaomingii TaxID=3058393 RepID=A0ABT8N1G7_9BACL|nr:GW dipeptide domain-containing protein [Planococcus sp. N028]MDN7241737.1 GW dipeptide domain-containing protein [Planococcus sp. N028]
MKLVKSLTALFLVLSLVLPSSVLAAGTATASSAATVSSVSMLGHLKSTTNRIYKDYKKLSVYTKAGSANTNEVFYIKKQAVYNKVTYYLISRNPSSTTGVVGWVKAADMTAQKNTVVDKNAKTFYAKGTGSAYTKPWGGTRNYYFKSLVVSTDREFKVNLTEKVGSVVWHRGVLNGKTVWIEAKHLSSAKKTPTSKLAHVKTATAKIYPDIDKLSSSIVAGELYTNTVFYVKKEAVVNGQKYYLLGKTASTTTGLIGWIKIADATAQTHAMVDTKAKTFYIIGTGSAYNKPWGGSKDFYYTKLSSSKGREFKVNLTEKVGSTNWYKGIVNDKTVWIEAKYVTSTRPAPVVTPPVTPPPTAVKEESPVSLVGKIEVSTVRIYADYTKQTAYTEAGTGHTDEVFYIKKQADFDGAVYYQLSRNAAGTTELAGWVKSTDIKTETHTAVDKNAKAFYVTGTGSAYSKVWGGSKNIAISDLAALKGSLFAVRATEKIGTALWHQGILDGKTVWIEASQLSLSFEGAASLLGQISVASVRIYPDYQKQTSYQEAGTANTNEVFYIKKQAAFNNALYYQLSRNVSGTEVVGWVKSSDSATQTHTLVDNNAKTFYLKGTGSAYTKIWGGTKNLSIQDMSLLKGSLFQVNATEKAGNTTWHQGIVSGKTVWIESSNLSASLESPVSLVGHVTSTSVRIYPNYLNQTSFTEAGTAHTDEVFYIKKQATFNSSTYYLISRNASSTTGIVGWVKSTDMNTQTHTSVDSLTKTYHVKGTGSAYSKIWGGTKNITFQNLSSLKGASFAINFTEKVGNILWHRGVLSGQTVWIQETDLIKVETKYTQYNFTFNEALTKQMGILQQTDKYANSKAYVASSAVTAIDAASTITTDGTRLRKSPDFTDNISYTVNKGTKITIVSTVTGASSAGSTKWYKISYAGATLYVHSSLVNTASATGTLAVKTNVMSAESATSHVYGTLAAGAKVTIKNQGTGWHEISYGAWRNPTSSDVATYLDPNNNDKFQHLLLTTSAGVSAIELNKILVGKGILTGLGQAFINGGRQYNVNEIYLISHALLETGQGTSALANGVEVGKNAAGTPVLVTTANRSSLTAIKKTYNMFGIGAVDFNALAGGAIKAYNSGWFTPEAAIVGGAQFVGTNYLDRGQDTLYKMRWNPANPATHQYASDIGWAAKQTVRMNALYNMLDSYTITLDIPKYK